MLKLTSIWLLVVLIAPASVVYLWLQYQKAIVKHAVKERLLENLEANELVLLKFTVAESTSKLAWEHSKEFEYNDQMYDVVETKIIGDTIYYWCWWDHAETKLNLQLSQLVNSAFHSDPQNQEKQQWLISYYKTWYVLGNFYPKLSPPVLTHQQPIEYIKLYFLASGQHTVPPPKWS